MDKINKLYKYYIASFPEFNLKINISEYQSTKYIYKVNKTNKTNKSSQVG